jgi:hypothetical protein
VGALVVAVVGNQQTSASAIVVQSLGTEGLRSSVAVLDLLGNLSNSIFLARVKELHKLRRLATRSSTHIENGHARSGIDEERRDHADNFLATDVSNVGLGDEEFLEGSERCKSSDNVLGGCHSPSKLIGVPRNWAWWLDELVFILDRCDFGDVVVLQTLLHSQRVSIDSNTTVSIVSSS